MSTIQIICTVWLGIPIAVLICYGLYSGGKFLLRGPEVREAEKQSGTLDKLSEEELLAKALHALEGACPYVERISDPDFLLQLAQEADSESVRRAAKERHCRVCGHQPDENSVCRVCGKIGRHVCPLSPDESCDNGAVTTVVSYVSGGEYTETHHCEHYPCEKGYIYEERNA